MEYVTRQLKAGLILTKPTTTDNHPESIISSSYYTGEQGHFKPHCPNYTSIMEVILTPF